MLIIKKGSRLWTSLPEQTHIRQRHPSIKIFMDKLKTYSIRKKFDRKIKLNTKMFITRLPEIHMTRLGTILHDTKMLRELEV
jgi:hypothetical protein